MKRIAVLGIVALGLTDCTTLSDNKLMDNICSHQITLRISANAALANAPNIKDAVLRQAAIDGANTTLALIAACPLDAPSTPR